ncbi:hypothetical protein LTR84_003684 [Exophiala bonariae]|uniref:Lysine-specific metallo-endopeptidase domain-containing protein n=1 Tax=Exophiala bonariae TaxID=1690606 RepID=A0AAV9N827_9EURO|nr:hypothetical protein LTR84_003684 [Exophiala bonariae]
MTVPRFQHTLTCFLILISRCDASFPQFIPASPNTHVANANAKLRVAFGDAILLARVAAVTFDPCDEIFLRYFRPEEAEFVKNVFLAVANIRTTEIDAENVESILSSPSVIFQLHDKFQNLEIALGDHPEVEDEDKICGRILTETGFGVYAYTTLDFDDFDIDAEGSKFSWQSICEESFEFPFLWDIELLATDPSGHVLAGHTCAGLGDRDSDFMDSPGGIILHELTHWSYLLENIPGFSDLIEGDEGGFHQIKDYSNPGGTPPNGLGAFHALQLRNVGPYTSIQNADNFKWYALSKYWAWRCGRVFSPSLSDADVYKRGPKGAEADPQVQGGN